MTTNHGDEQPVYVPVPVPYKPATTSTNGWAVTSLILGIVGIGASWALLAIPSVAAVVLAYLALSQINHDPTQGGRGAAVTGLVLGYLVGVPALFVWAALIIGSAS